MFHSHSSLPATLTVEEVYQDRDQFAQLVREVAGMDVGRMGIEILSFTIKVRVRRYNSCLPTDDDLPHGFSILEINK